MEGYFMVNRAMMKTDIWLSEPFTKAQAWLDLIGLARYKDGTIWIGSTALLAKRGQVYMSQVSLGKRWKWSRNKVRKYLSQLEKVQQIEQHSEGVTTCISVLNYNKYQSKVQQKDSEGTGEGQEKDRERTGKGQEEVHNRIKEKKGNKGKKDNNVRVESIKKEFLEDLEQFDYSPEMKQDFFEYWTEKSKRDTLVRFEKERSFDISRRLKTWKRRDDQNNSGRPKQKTVKSIDELKLAQAK